MADKDYKVGDKFIIEIGSLYWNPQMGNRYFIKGYDTLVFDDKGLNRLKKYEPKKEVPHTCEHCVYKEVTKEVYPCAVCENNYDVEPRDMFIEGRAIKLNNYE